MAIPSGEPARGLLDRSISALGEGVGAGPNGSTGEGNKTPDPTKGARVKIFISSDMEGTAGVVDWDQCRPGHHDYEHCRDLAGAGRAGQERSDRRAPGR